MNIRKASLSIGLMAVLSLFGSSCKKYLDVNTNPNVAQDAGPEFLLPSAQVYLGSAMGVDMQIIGSIWAQHWTQSPASSQYKIYEQYSPSASSFDRVWTLFYANELEDLDQMEKKAAASNQVFYVAISKIMKSYTYQVITDAWGDVPYSEALRGEAQNGGIVSPHYDPQSQIYDSIISMAKSGMGILNSIPASSTVTGDLMYAGSVTKWRQFGNTLILKLYMRLSEKDPARAQAGITALYANAPTFITLGNDAQIVYSATAGNQNPLYSEEVGLSKTQNLVASATVLDSMTKGNVTAPADVRATVFFKPAPTGYLGLKQGFYTAPSSTPVAIPSAAVGADANNTASATAPVKFMTSYESALLQAEAVARGWGGTAGSDSTLFYTGIRNNFQAYGLTVAQANAYIAANYWGQYPYTGTAAQKVRHIVTQKWFTMTGNQGFEAWTEWRRTGYPSWFTISVNSIIGPKFPHRFFYPDVEVQRNQNFPGQKLITDRVYWDIH